MDYKHLSEEEIARAAEAMLHDDYERLPSEISLHLKDCQQCANEVLTLCSILEENATHKGIHHLDALLLHTRLQTVTRLIVGIAASVLVIIGIYFWYDNNDLKLNSYSENNINQSIDQQSDTSAGSIPDTLEGSFPVSDNTSDMNTELLAFAENPELEKLAQRFNQSPFRAEGPKIITLGTLTVDATDKVFLKWEGDEIEYLIQVNDNSGTSLVESKSATGSFEINLPAGLYYWKLLDTEYNLVFCGKIIVK
ncbi:MAG: hypothetical protein K9I34_02770 [Bacteroidales bacterium]|nr:hypothetical protein [Bacteroidales bacterium]